MYANITLYKTNFDKENIFVGTSKAFRQNIFDTFDNSQKLVLEKSTINPKYPFRIIGNFFDYDRKYNYAQYEYLNNDLSIKEKRFYFIDNFQFINDNETGIIVTEDILGNIFWDLSFSRIIPDSYTYKLSDLDRKFKPIDNSNTFEVVNEINMLQKVTGYTIDSEDCYIGFLLLTCTVTAFVTDSNFSESALGGAGMSYPVLTLLLPFIFTLSGKIKMSHTGNNMEIGNFYLWEYNGTTDNYTRLCDAGNFASVCKITENGFKILSTSYFINCKDLVTCEYLEKTISGEPSVSFWINANNNLGDCAARYRADSNVNKITRISLSLQNTSTTKVTAYCMQVIKSYVGKTTVRNNLFVYKSYSKFPYQKITITENNNEINLDMMSVKSDTSIYLQQSLLPPYNSILTIQDGKYQYVYNNFFKWSRDEQFIEFNDTFSEWYKSNYNSAITGLKVKQKTDWQQFGLSSGLSFLKSGVSGTADILSSSNAEQGAISAIGNQINSMINIGGNAGQIGINHNKENQMLNLRMEDIKNTPDYVSFSSSLMDIILSKKYFRFIQQNNMLLSENLRHHEMYGYESYVLIFNIKTHKFWDYIRMTNFIMKNSNISLNESDKILLETFFKNGVRLWYDYSEYKNFNAINAEV